MLERTLVFVDTSYLLASFYNSWEEGARTQLEIDLPEVCSVLDRMITQHVGQPVQRQNWYDGIPDSGPHRYQRALRTVDGVQLRAGLLIETGQRRTQKAVDTRLVADMILAAVRQQFSDMVLVSGDQDMIPGVVEASAMGVRVHLYGFSWDSMSNALRHKCDSITVLDPREDFADTMQIQPLEGPIPPSIPPRPLEAQDPIVDGQAGDNAASGDAPTGDVSFDKTAPGDGDSDAGKSGGDGSEGGASGASVGGIGVADSPALSADKRTASPAGDSADNGQPTQNMGGDDHSSRPDSAHAHEANAHEADRHGAASQPGNTGEDTWTSRRVRGNNNAAVGEHGGQSTSAHESHSAGSTPSRPTPADMMACARRSANAADRRHSGDRDGNRDGNRGPEASTTTAQARPADADQAVPGQTEHSPSGGSPATRIPESSVGKQRTTQPAEAVGGALAANEGSTTEAADNPAPKDDSKPEDPRSADRPTTVATPGSVAARHQAAQLAASQQASDGGSDGTASGDDSNDDSGNGSAHEASTPTPQPKPAPKPSMMAPRRKLRSRYVPLPNEIWTTTGFQTPFDVGQQYATWWFHHVATEEQRDSAHVLSGGGLPPNVDRPLLQFACESLHEYTLSESQRVSLRDGFHTGIRAILITGED